MNTTVGRWQRADIGVAGPTARDMLRAFRAVRADPLTFLVATRHRFGDLAAFPVPGPPVLLVSGPSDVRRVLQLGARHWVKRTVQYSSLSRLTGPGLLASSDPSWLAHRRAAAPAFHHQRLEAVGELVRDAARQGVSGWGDAEGGGSVIDVAPMALRVALDVVGRALFSADLSSRSERLLDATNESAQLVVALARSVLPLPPWAPRPTTWRLRAARRELDRLCQELIARRRAAAAPTHGSDLLGLMLGAGLADREVHDELITMVVAGHETVAAGLTWTLMLLAQHQEVQDRLREELRGHRRGVPMIGTAASAPWLHAVLHESLRLYPPAWVVSRRTVRADVLSGVDVPAGTTAIISPWLVHRGPSSWPQPDVFRPERFLNEPGTTARADYIPFGIGPRLCIGREFALGEMAIVLGEVLSQYSLAVPGESWRPPAPQALLSVHPTDGMPLRLVPLGSRMAHGGAAA